MHDPPHSSEQDAHWMRAALVEAARGVGVTSPNPPVGAVIVRDGVALAAGYHAKAGGPHAEAAAIAALPSPDAPRGATLYVTLEPCSTHGRTPPCTGAIIGAGIGRVVYGARDPNPHHAGAADRVLGAAGIAVQAGVLAAECEALIRPFSKWIRTGLPWVVLKAAMSLDGRITRPPGEGQWLTDAAARADAMALRAQADAILVGANTVREDDPQLTLRGEAVPAGKAQPWRAVVSRSGDLPPGSYLFTDEHRDRTLVYSDAGEALCDLARRGCTAVLAEGGGQLHAALLAGRFADEAVLYYAPSFCGAGCTPGIGALEASVSLKNVATRQIGDQVVVAGEIGYPPV
ncbi:MAG: bifunctional diaminohydroxyphosphoribosylaminopyrimidine deaminase/5-amino-6-(5-phosphoribosylamino)uracil reductase RibD [Verrucomicrobiales bacterium]